MKQFQKGNFQKTFGYTENMKHAQMDFVKSENRASFNYKFGTAISFSLFIFLALQLGSFSWPSWQIKFYELHKCNLKMIFFRKKYKPMMNLLEKEKQSLIKNWYFHVVMLNKLKDYAESLRYQRYEDKEAVVGIAAAIGMMLSLYEDNEIEKHSEMFVKSLCEAVYELVLTMEKMKINNNAQLIPCFELFFSKCKEKELLKAHIALQILIERDHTDSLSSLFSQQLWESIENGLHSTNEEIVQSCKDILTYFAISSQKFPINYPFSLTTQDIFIKFRQELQNANRVIE